MQTWAIFDETWDIRVVGGAESNGGVHFARKSIFAVESIESTIKNRSILIDLLKRGRFLTKLRVWGFSIALNRTAVFVCLENRYFRSNRSIRPLRSDLF